MTEQRIIMGPRRGRIAVQAATFVLAGIALGYLLRGMSCFNTSGSRGLAERLGVPASVLTLGILGIVLAVVVAYDDLRHRIELADSFFIIRSNVGVTAVRYANIRNISKMPGYGVAIGLRNTAEWLASYQGKPSGRQKLQRVTGLLQSMRQCDLAILGKHLDVGVDEFIRLLEERMRQHGIVAESDPANA